jgi:hypothetical protein
MQPNCWLKITVYADTNREVAEGGRACIGWKLSTGSGNAGQTLGR